MNTCKDCKWWDVMLGDGWEEAWRGRGWCNNPKLLWEPGVTDGADMLSAGEGSVPCVPDTGPDFGCIHWEAK